MRAVWVVLCFLFLVGALLCSPAHADSVVAVTVPTVTFTGNSVCGAGQATVCVESFNASFQWDNTTNSVLPGTTQIMAVGPLGNFSFFGSIVNSFGPGGGQLLIAIWTNAAGDSLTADINAPLTGLVPGTYPIVGPFQPGDAGAGLGCNISPLDSACASYFLNPGGQELAPNPMVVTGVPEGPTSFMLLLGLLSMVLWRFRVIRSAQ